LYLMKKHMCNYFRVVLFLMKKHMCNYFRVVIVEVGGVASSAAAHCTVLTLAQRVNALEAFDDFPPQDARGPL